MALIRSQRTINRSILQTFPAEQGSVRGIEPSDEVDFYNMLQVSGIDRMRFENHWPYILQATRNSGFVYKDNHTRIYYYFRHIHRTDELVVVNCFGPNTAKGLSILKDYTIENHMSLCIKNILVQNLPYWEKLGYHEKKTHWNQYSSKDDNSCPEFIYDLKVIAEAHLPVTEGQIRSCRASHANRLRKFLRERNIVVKPYDPKLHKNVVYNLLVDNADFLEKKGVDSKQNVIDAHNFVFNDELLYKKRLIHVENNTILGFNYITVINDIIFGNALIHKNLPDLMRFLVWQGFNYVYKQLEPHKKYYVSLQGSENIGQYHWKKGFAPIKEILKTHITYQATPCQSLTIAKENVGATLSIDGEAPTKKVWER